MSEITQTKTTKITDEDIKKKNLILVNVKIVRAVEGLQIKLQSDLSFDFLKDYNNGRYSLGDKNVYYSYNHLCQHFNQHKIAFYTDRPNQLIDSKTGFINCGFLLAEDNLKNGVVFTLKNFPYSSTVIKNFLERFRHSVKLIYSEMMKPIKFEVSVFSEI